MKRLRPTDAVTMAVILPLWAICFALHVKQITTGRLAWVPVFVRVDAQTRYPVVQGFWPGTGAEGSGLLVGDRIVRLGGEDLRGVGPFGFVARVYANADAELRVPLTYQRGATEAGVKLGLSRVAYPWRTMPLTLGLVIAGVLVVIRRPRSSGARAIFLATSCYSLHWLLFPGGPPIQTYAWTGVFTVTATLIFPLLLLGFQRIPDTPRPDSSWLGRIWPWSFALLGPASTSWVFGVPFAPDTGVRATLGLNVAFIVAALATLTRNFRRSDPIGRRQVKWVVYGVYVGLVPVLAAAMIATIQPSLWWLHELSMIATPAIPLCIFIALVRSNFYDIDRLISSTASYSLLSVLIVTGVLTVVPRLSQAASGVMDLDPSSAQVLFSLGMATLIVPAQRVLLGLIQRLFFEERHALERGIQELLRDLSLCTDPRSLLTLAGQRLDHLLRPESCVIYGEAGSAYTPVFQRGAAVPSAIAADSGLVAALQLRAAPLDVEQFGRRRMAAQVAAVDLATLESLAVAVLVPIPRGQAMPAFICLGDKRSGDFYTSTDLALLAAVADKVSDVLLRFDVAEVHREAQAMQTALRRYVPGAIASGLERGRDLRPTEREVTVLFVDIRGYATFAEGKRPETIFSVINQYTETVSAIVREHGGNIVEFNGDGMMTVFGAPEPLPEKEQAAVVAARQIVDGVARLTVDGKPGSLSAGVGIATGPAFVGSIRSVDRLIWSAIGNTTNLASRLQSLTRELEAAIVIDSRTYRPARLSCPEFQLHPRRAIRGRKEPEDLYALPLYRQLAPQEHAGSDVRRPGPWV